MAWTTQQRKKGAPPDARAGAAAAGGGGRWTEARPQWNEDDGDDQDEDEPEYDRKFDFAEGQAFKPTIKQVQVDGLVLLKIIKHATEKAPEAVTGLLLGLDIDDRLEATNCFPTPTSEKEEEEDEHQVTMMKCLASVNVDNNTVGWYQSALLGTWCNASTIEEQYNYQKEIPNSVVIIYDPFSTTRGRLALKAFRLTTEFLELYAAGDFSHTGFSKRSLDSTKIFEEIPIKVHNSHLVHGFLYELREKKSMSCGFDRLHRSAGPFLTKTLGILSTHVDYYCSECNRFQYDQRAIARYQKQLQEATIARRVENEARTAQGLDPLEGPLLSVKAPAQPSRLETFLTQHQMRDYCDQIQCSISLAFNQLYVAKGLQEDAQD